MKKTFTVIDPKVSPIRRAEAIKGEIKKYVKRENRKKIPDGFDFWDFRCSFGDSVENKKELHLTEINKHIDDALTQEKESFYVEILAEARKRTKKEPSPEAADKSL